MINCGAERIRNYVAVAFRDILNNEYNDHDDRCNAIQSIFDHLDEKSDHNNLLYVNNVIVII